MCVGVLRYNGATWRSDSPSRSIYHSLAERPNCFGRHSYSFSLLKAIIPGLASSECSVFYITSVSETIRKPPLVKAQTAF